jgi:hypothetical protein
MLPLTLLPSVLHSQQPTQLLPTQLGNIPATSLIRTRCTCKCRTSQFQGLLVLPKVHRNLNTETWTTLMPAIQASTPTLTPAFPISTCQLFRQTGPFKTPLPFQTSRSLPKPPPLHRASKPPAHHSLLTPFALPRSTRNSHRSGITTNILKEPQPSRIGPKTTPLHKPGRPLIPQLPTWLFRVTTMVVTDLTPGSAILSTYQFIPSPLHPHDVSDLSRAQQQAHT